MNIFAEREREREKALQIRLYQFACAKEQISRLSSQEKIAWKRALYNQEKKDSII